MTKLLKIIIWVIIGIIAIPIIWWLYTPATPEKENTPTAPIENQTSTPITTNEYMSAPNNISDLGLSQDLSYIDNKLSILKTNILDVEQNIPPYETFLPSIDETNSSLATIIITADNEIDQKINNLNDLLLNISTLKKIDAIEKTRLSALVQGEIDKLKNLKVKIDTGNNRGFAISDYQQLTANYKIYNLLMPQISIITTADKAMLVTEAFDFLGKKVETRLPDLTGINAITLNQKLVNFNTKINTANNESMSAILAVLNLQPDQENSTIKQKNLNALKNAITEIKSSENNFTSARKDIGDIIKFLKENKPTQK